MTVVTKSILIRTTQSLRNINYVYIKHTNIPLILSFDRHRLTLLFCQSFGIFPGFYTPTYSNGDFICDERQSDKTIMIFQRNIGFLIRRAFSHNFCCV